MLMSGRTSQVKEFTGIEPLIVYVAYSHYLGPHIALKHNCDVFGFGPDIVGSQLLELAPPDLCLPVAVGIEHRIIGLGGPLEVF